MGIRERLKQFIEYKGISKYRFYKELDLSNGFLDKEGSIGSEKCEKIIYQYPELNITWLLTGQGNMLNTKEECSPIAHHANNPNEGIPLIPLSAMAGVFTGDQTVLEYECEHYVVPAFKGADFLIPVKGSSMVPKYNSGDIVACKKLSMSDYFFQWNKVYVLDTDQGALIKRVNPGSDKDHILIVSENSDYKPFELGLDHIYNLALVVGVIQLE